LRGQKTEQTEDETNTEEGTNDEVQEEPNRDRMGGRGMNRLRNRAAGQAQVEEEEEKQIDPSKISKKELHKIQKRQEKAKMREDVLAIQEARDKKKEERLKDQEDREKEREEEEQKEEEAERKRLEEIKKKEEEEYTKWKDMIDIEETGQEETEDEKENKLQTFIDYIAIRKVVLLEDLSAEFKLSTKDIVDRIKALEMNGRLKGIIDDRGKYIYITQEEVSAVENFIKRKGRVSKADLVVACNRLVRLNPKQEDKAKIIMDQKSILEQAAKEVEA